jgi:hypothetical protein
VPAITAARFRSLIIGEARHETVAGTFAGHRGGWRTGRTDCRPCLVTTAQSSEWCITLRPLSIVADSVEMPKHPAARRRGRHGPRFESGRPDRSAQSRATVARLVRRRAQLMSTRCQRVVDGGVDREGGIVRPDLSCGSRSARSTARPEPLASRSAAGDSDHRSNAGAANANPATALAGFLAENWTGHGSPRVPRR